MADSGVMSICNPIQTSSVWAGRGCPSTITTTRPFVPSCQSGYEQTKAPPPPKLLRPSQLTVGDKHGTTSAVDRQHYFVSVSKQTWAKCHRSTARWSPSERDSLAVVNMQLQFTAENISMHAAIVTPLTVNVWPAHIVQLSPSCQFFFLFCFLK